MQADGTFEYSALPGHYSVELCEFSSPEIHGRTRLLRRMGKTTINVTEADLDGIEIQISSLAVLGRKVCPISIRGPPFPSMTNPRAANVRG